MNKLAILIAAVALVLSLFAFGGGDIPVLGGVTNFDILDVTDGYRVDGTERISGTGAFVPTTIAASGEAQLRQLVHGGDVTSISSGSETFTAAQVCNTSIFRYTPTASATVLTMPSAASMISDCLDTVGDMKRVIFENLADDERITFVAGAGMDLSRASGSGDLQLDARQMVVADFWQSTSATVSSFFDELLQ